MEIASTRKRCIRPATRGDTKEILALFQRAELEHRHADWTYPVDWISTKGFLICEEVGGDSAGRISACLAAGSDPPPASWVRLAAARSRRVAEECLPSMLGRIIEQHEKEGLTEIGWLQANPWPQGLLSDLGFEIRNWIITYVKFKPGTLPSVRDDIIIRDARLQDMEALAHIEMLAFEPLWRHSAHGLTAAFEQAISFDAAMVGDTVVGFQYSVSGLDNNTAHLVRITVHPEYQRMGVGSALMERALRSYYRMDRPIATLNTQLDNLASHRLYEKFGFKQLGEQIPLWTIEISKGEM